MPGDLNPSLPVARELIDQGHQVHYLCFEQFRDAIEDTGATLHSALEYESELYAGREPGIFGAFFPSLQTEHGLSDAGPYCTRVCLEYVQIELQLPGVLRFLDAVGATGVVYDPVVCPEAAVAARVRGLPAAALLAFAGPGAWAKTVDAKLEGEGLSAEALDAKAKAFEPNRQVCARRRTAPSGRCARPNERVSCGVGPGAGSASRAAH